MPVTLELIIAFDDLPPDAPVGFALRCDAIQCSARGTFTNPLDARALGDIRWYLEDYFKWPTDIDQERAHEIEAKMLQVWCLIWELLTGDTGSLRPS